MDQETKLLAGVVAFSVILFVTVSAVGAAFVFGIGPVDDDQEREPPGPDPAFSPTTFEEVAADRGFVYEYVEGEIHGGMISLTTDAGVYVVDFNDNGRDDVLAIGGEEPVLFENVGGEFLESDALPELDTSANGALFFDHDNDGYEDLLLLPPGSEPIFLENQEGEFVVREAGFDVTLSNPTGATAADFTGDGCLDVFVVQNGDWDETRPVGTAERGVGDDDNGNPNHLFYGDCSYFERADETAITDDRWTLAVASADLSGNGHPDVYEANDFNYDVLYENRGDGTFERHRMDRSDRNAMSATVADVTGTGELDVFVTNIYFDHHVRSELPITQGTAGRTDGNNLFVNLGDGAFEDRASAFGVREGGWGWAAAIADYNNDGELSIVHTTSPIGVDRALQDRLGMSEGQLYYNYPYLRYPMMFERASETRFRTVQPPDRGFEEGGGRGIVTLDLDGDGSLDLAVADTRTPYKLYENQGAAGNWLRVDVRGDGEHTELGAEVYVETDDRTLYDVKHANSDFLSQEPRVLHFGVGDAERVDLRVVWPDGTERTFENVAIDRHVRVTPDGELEDRTDAIDGG